MLAFAGFLHELRTRLSVQSQQRKRIRVDYEALGRSVCELNCLRFQYSTRESELALGSLRSRFSCASRSYLQSR